jgi:2-polyprenyl-6-hydroxyphenyl methylase/3-demethylubiquinone-9 3-methyltransferase
MDTGGYHFGSAIPAHTHEYLLPTLFKLLKEYPPPCRIFELGCGNGATANVLRGLGYDVTAVDPSVEGIRIAKDNYSGITFAVGSAYDELAKKYGKFRVVVSLEVIEHIFYPRRYAATVADLLAPGGGAIISTPYHGYVKNLVLALLNKWETHMDPLWDYGHIKVWSRSTIGRLFDEVGLRESEFYRVGRIPQIAKSMILSFTKS